MRLAAFAPRDTLTALARAGGGAILFGLPLLMTMEMWSLGGYVARDRLVAMVVVNIPLLIALSHYIGFEPTGRLRDDVADAFVAYLIAFVASAALLALFGEIDAAMSIDEITGKLVVQAVPGSIGAALASKELAGDDDDDPPAAEEDPTYLADVFYMVVGALFLAFNMAPTEEMVLIAYQMAPWQPLVLALASLGLMNAFVYAMEFRGQHSRPPGTSLGTAFVRYTVVGYALALLVSLYVLWTFGRLDGLSREAAASVIVVLSFPGAIGAAAARLIL